MYVLDGGLTDWINSGYPMETGDVTFKHRNQSLEKYIFDYGDFQFCKKDFVEKQVSELKKK